MTKRPGETSNVVKLFSGADDFKSCSYFMDEHDAVGISMRDLSVSLRPLNSGTIELNLGGETKIYDRSEIAEFLKVAAILVDSENRHLPDFDLVGLSY